MKIHQFVAVQAGIFEHFEDGRLTPTMWCVLSVILYQLDYETGFWRGSAEKLAVAWCHGLSKRVLQRALDDLCQRGYLKSFHKPGQRGNYPVAVHKYPIRFGRHKGRMLNARVTTNPDYPVYVPDPRQAESNGDHESRACSRAASGKMEKESESEDVVAPTATMISVPISEPTHVSSGAYSRYQNIEGEREQKEKEIQEGGGNTNNINSTKERYSFAAVASADPAPNTDSFCDQGGAPWSTKHARCEQSVIARESRAFLAEIQRIFKQHSPYRLNTTVTHREQAFQMACEHGREAFLGAMEVWLIAEKDRWCLGQENALELPTAAPKPATPKTWLLKEFMDSGAALNYITQVKPYVHIARGEALACILGFLRIESDGEPIGEVTADDVALLERLLEDENANTIISAFRYAQKNLQGFLNRAEEFIELWNDRIANCSPEDRRLS